MNKKFIAGGTVAGLVLAGSIAGMVSAQTASAATGLSQEQIMEIALMEVPGEVTEVERERRRGKQVYEVEIIGVDGTEMEVTIAAETGEILKVEAEGEDCDKDHDDKGDAA